MLVRSSEGLVAPLMSIAHSDGAKAAWLDTCRRALGIVCVLYVALLLVVKAPASLVVLRTVWHSYLYALRRRCGSDPLVGARQCTGLTRPDQA